MKPQFAFSENSLVILQKGSLRKYNRQIENKGFVVKAGTLIDATFYPAATRPPGKDKKPKDPEASCGAKGKGKNKKHCYGYKAHIGVDQDSGIIRKAEMTQARVNGSIRISQ